MKLDSLPEVEKRDDSDQIIISKDGVHLSKITAKNFGKGLGGGSGALEYWTETKDEFYKELNVEPTNMEAIIRHHVDETSGGGHRYYYSVFGIEEEYNPLEPSTSSTSKEAAIKRCLAYAKASTNGGTEQPTDFVTTSKYDQGLNCLYSGYIDIHLENPDGSLTPFDLQTRVEYEEDGFRYDSSPEVQAYEYDPGDIRVNGYLGSILDPDPSKSIPRAGNHYGIKYDDLNNYKTSTPVLKRETNGYAGYNATRSTSDEWVYEYNVIPNERIIQSTILQYRFIVQCHGKRFAVDDDHTDLSVLTGDAENVTIDWPVMVPNARVEDIYYDWTSVTDRSLNGWASFSDENNIWWRVEFHASPEPKAEGATADAGYDTLRPDGMNHLDIGYTPEHWSLYKTASPVDAENTGSTYINPDDLTETFEYKVNNLSQESIDIYKANILKVAKDVVKALGLKSTPAEYKGDIEEGDIPGDAQIKTRTAIVNKEDGTAFSAGMMDADGNYTETIKMDAKTGKLYLNGVEVSGGSGGGGVLTPVYSEGTKIADYTTESGNTELYIPETGEKDPDYQSGSSAGYTYFYTVKKVGTWSGDFHKSYAAQTINTCVDRDIYEVTFIARASSQTYSAYVEYDIPLHSSNSAKYETTGNELGPEYNFIPLHAEALVHKTSANTWVPTTPTITMSASYDTAKVTIPSQGSGTSGQFNAVVIKIRYVG